jgi:hypothetical protein
MKPFAMLLAVLAAAAFAAPASAQAPQPRASNLVRPRGASLLNNPNARFTPHPLHGRACNGPIMAQRAQAAVNPINGQAQAAPIISIPLNKNSVGVANSTSRAQQAQACAHTR